MTCNSDRSRSDAGVRLCRVVVSVGALGGALAAQQAQAAITPPTGLNPGDTFYLMFLTSGTIKADSSDPTGYNSLVSGEATVAGLGTFNGNPVTWQALGSYYNGATASSLFNPDAPIYTLDGDLVANDAADLYDGSIANPVNVFADGTEAASPINVWTGSTSSGAVAVPGAYNKGIGSTESPIPTPGTAASQFGLSDSVDSGWLSVSNGTNTTFFPLYAFSSEIAVVPEPTTGVFAAIGAVGAAVFRRRRR